MAIGRREVCSTPIPDPNPDPNPNPNPSPNPNPTPTPNPYPCPNPNPDPNPSPSPNPNPNQGVLYPGEVLAMNREDDTVDLLYDDGDFESHVPRERLHAVSIELTDRHACSQPSRTPASPHAPFFWQACLQPLQPSRSPLAALYTPYSPLQPLTHTPPLFWQLPLLRCGRRGQGRPQGSWRVVHRPPHRHRYQVPRLHRQVPGKHNGCRARLRAYPKALLTLTHTLNLALAKAPTPTLTATLTTDPVPNSSNQNGHLEKHVPPSRVQPLSSAHVKNDYVRGDRVRANWHSCGTWCLGRVQSVDTLEGTFNVQYDDGEIEARQHAQKRCLFAAPELGPCAASGRTRRLWADQRSQGERGVGRATGRPVTASGKPPRRSPIPLLLTTQVQIPPHSLQTADETEAKVEEALPFACHLMGKTLPPVPAPADRAGA